MLGQTVNVIVDRPLGSYHSLHDDIYYSVNYGYVPDVFSADGEEQDAYILGIDYPISEFTGKAIAIIHRIDDVEDKLIVVPDGVMLTKEEIAKQVDFQEKFFKTEIIM